MPKKEKKLSDSFWEIKLLIEKLTTDGRTTTTDESALEKLRCLSAGGAKNWCKKKFRGGGGGVQIFFLEKQFFLISRFMLFSTLTKFPGGGGGGVDFFF